MQYLSGVAPADCTLPDHYCNRSLVSLGSNLVLLAEVCAIQRTAKYILPSPGTPQFGQKEILMPRSMLRLETCDQNQFACERRVARLQLLDDQLAQPIYSLPWEILMIVIEHTDIAEIPAIIAGLYHVLVKRRIVPDLSPRTVSWARALLGWPFRRISSNIFFPRHHTEPQLPMELTLQIQDYLSGRDKINLVLAIYKIPTSTRYSLDYWQI